MYEDTPTRVQKIDPKIMKEEKKKGVGPRPPPPGPQPLYLAWRGIMACNVNDTGYNHLCIYSNTNFRFSLASCQ